MPGAGETWLQPERTGKQKDPTVNLQFDALSGWRCSQWGGLVEGAIYNEATRRLDLSLPEFETVRVPASSRILIAGVPHLRHF